MTEGREYELMEEVKRLREWLEVAGKEDIIVDIDVNTFRANRRTICKDCRHESFYGTPIPHSPTCLPFRIRTQCLQRGETIRGGGCRHCGGYFGSDSACNTCGYDVS